MKHIQETYNSAYQGGRIFDAEGSHSANCLKTLSHACYYLHLKFKLIQGHLGVTVTGVVLQPGVRPHPPSSGLERLDLPNHERSYQIYGVQTILLQPDDFTHQG